MLNRKLNTKKQKREKLNFRDGGKSITNKAWRQKEGKTDMEDRLRQSNMYPIKVPQEKKTDREKVIH